MIYRSPDEDGGFPEDKVINNLTYSENKIMKKQHGFGDFIFFMVILGVVIIMLASCNDKSEKKPEATGHILVREQKVLEIYKEYTESLGMWPIRVRTDLEQYAESRSFAPTRGFFCDAKDLVVAGSYKVKRFNQENNKSLKSPSEIYEEVYGESVERSCGIIVIGGSKKPETPKDFTEVQDVVRGDKLTPEMYDKMIQSANYCARSKQFMMEKTKNKGLLTTEDYDGLMDTVLECKRFELEQTLQQG